MSTIRLIPDSFVQHCTSVPNDVFIHVVQTDSDNEKTISKTRRELLTDALHAAQYLRERVHPVRRPGDAPSCVGILMRSGYACFVQFLGILMNRLTPVLISPRNSAEGILHLIRMSQSLCLVADGTQDNVLAFLRTQLPSLSIIESENSQHTPSFDHVSPDWLNITHEERLAEAECVAYYLHTSGSTGHPKLIPETHREWWDRAERLMRHPGRPLVVMVPMFHTMGLSSYVRFPFGMGCIPVIVETNQPYSAELICHVLRHFPGAVCIVPPAILDDIAAGHAGSVSVLATAHRVLFAGAPLAKPAGDKLASAGVKLVSAYGCTEAGQLTTADAASEDPLDWQYMQFLAPDQISFVPVAESDNLYQLVVKPGRFVDPTHVNHTDPVGFCTGDVWQPHPTKDGLWKHMGRRGTVTVLNNGEKTDNGQLGLISQSSLVQHAIVFGEGRFQNGIIVQPSGASWSPEKFLEAVWPTVVHANTVIPKHSRLVKELVLVADPNKKFVLSDKATVRRQETLRLYELEIEQAYDRLEQGTSTHVLPAADDDEGALAYIRRVVGELLGKDVQDDANLFDYGMDSLLAISCRSSLIPLAKLRGRQNVPRNVVYHHPAIYLLVDFVMGSAPPVSNREQRLQALLAEIEHAWPLNPKSDASDSQDSDGFRRDTLVVLLTGSTGTFGSQILQALLESQAVTAVYCLNRQTTISPAERQRRNMDDPTVLDKYSSKVEFWEMDIAEENLGLTDEALSKVRTSVTHFVHCAWEINFNHPVEHFARTQLRGVQNLVNLALSSYEPRVPRVVFLSSTAATAHYQGPEEEIPECTFDDMALPLNQGYAEAKYLAEQLISRASQKTGIPATIIRAGQLSGSTRTGAWNTKEVIPLFFQSCDKLGCTPDTLPDVRWMPADIAARIVTDIILHDTSTPVESVVVRQIENSYLLDGHTLVHSLLSASQDKLRTISVEDWLSAVRDAGETIPAGRILDAIEAWLSGSSTESYRPLSTMQTRGISREALGIRIDNDLVAAYWGHAVRSEAMNT
ncbi:acetyl-CoA synthetase-like protein [Obba rivulosa]|uniref:Acetyl-CoA synthetase-like protein n=1 Tax=Obba rivulosa TaxID=1052685 RepID=A0A8E2AM70_9APHY|nr:acetyl-CoA synthetase-like protein [Obba rivulosa]